MINGMTTAKIAVSVPQEVLRRARLAVRRGRAPSMSAFVVAALERKTKLDDLEERLAEMLSESGGRLTAKERSVADRTILRRRERSSRGR